MNFLTIKKANWIVATVILATSGMLATSCSKDKDKTAVEQTDQHEGTNLVLSINGINEGSNSSVKQASSTNSNTKLNVKSYSDVDVVTAVDNNVPFTAASGISVKNGSSGPTAAANNSLRAAALPSGVTYRLYLLSADGTQVLSSQQFTVGGTAVTVPVSAGQTYKWVALSYNNQDAIPTITTGNTSLLLPENKDVLFASGNVTIPATPGSDVSLPITFNHVFSRLAIELNTMGIFGPMNSGTVSVSGLTLRTGTLNLATGALTPAATTFTPTINWASFTNIDPAFSDAKIAYAYTASTAALSNIVMSVSNLAITHADGVNRTYGSVNPINIGFNVTPVLGNNHRLLANIVESPLVSANNATKWARSNLYYQAGHNPYRFYADNAQTAATDGSGFFAFGSVIPRKLATAATNQDPCKLVYPAGLWRQPTHTDFQPYTTGDGLLSNILGNILQLLAPAPAPGATGDNNTGTFIEYPLAATNSGGGNPAFGATSNALRFYYNGEITDVNVLNFDATSGLINLNFGTSRGREVAFWTNESGTNLLGPITLPGLGAWAYHAAKKQTVLGARFLGAQGTAEPLANINLLGLSVVQSTFKNVRCVRN